MKTLGIKKIRGVEVTDGIVNELKEAGRSRVLKFMNAKGKQYLAHFEEDDGKIVVVPETRYLEHRCPDCGGRIRITSKGYFCEHSLGSDATCNFHCNGILSHRFIKPHEIEAQLDGHPVVLDGCFNSEGRIFSAVLVKNDIYGYSLSSVVDKCPVSGGKVFVSPSSFNCYNYENTAEPHVFSLWRHIKGHEITLDELHELLTDGCTSSEVILNDENGSLSKAVLRLSPDRKRIIPDFYSDSDK